MFFLKLLRGGRLSERDILEYMAQFVSQDNHVIRPVATRSLDEGTLLLLPYAGVTLDRLCDSRLPLLSTAYQFLKAVAFLHAHGVAHCDLKTSNVVVDLDTGHLTLIDFDLAVRGVDWLDGFTGTDGWTAPEVGNVARYDPKQADVWSTGKVLAVFCDQYPESADRKFLLEISEQLMVTDPEARPKMKHVVDAVERRISWAHPKQFTFNEQQATLSLGSLS